MPRTIDTPQPLIRHSDVSSDSGLPAAAPELLWDGKEFQMKRNLDILFVLLATAGILLGQDRFDYTVRNYFFAGFGGDAAYSRKA